MMRIRCCSVHEDLQRIYAFLENYEKLTAENSPQLDTDYPATAELSAAGLRYWYQKLARQRGRNNALFQAASLARDRGWSQQDVITLLLDVHVMQPAAAAHGPETESQRRREGLLTIRSAFRYSRRIFSARGSRVFGLPNSIREKLLQTGQVAAARVLDGLLLSGIKAGRTLRNARPASCCASMALVAVRFRQR